MHPCRATVEKHERIHSSPFLPLAPPTRYKLTAERIEFHASVPKEKQEDLHRSKGNRTARGGTVHASVDCFKVSYQTEGSPGTGEDLEASFASIEVPCLACVCNMVDLTVLLSE